MKKCELCGVEKDALCLSVGDMELCEACHIEIGKRGNSLINDEETQSEIPDMAELTVNMDARMLRTLEVQADVEGFVSLEAFVHSILFLKAVSVFIQDLAEPETVQEEADYIRQMRDWFRWQ